MASNGSLFIMKAIISDQPGPPEALVYGDLPDPVAGAGQVRIAVHAAALNFPDLLIIEDRYQVRGPRPFAPGFEAAGVIDQVGEGVQGLATGDRVLSYGYWGALAQFHVADAANVVPIPDGMPFETAAALPLTYFTSHYGLTRRAQLQPGETLLVLGAAGGIGAACVQLGKALGARVVAAVSSAAKADLARANGADEVMIYPSGDDLDGRALAAAFKAAVGEGGADVIVDVLGGAYSEAALRAIAWDGRHLVIGFAAGMTAMPLNLVLLKGCQVMGVIWAPWAKRFPDLARADQQAVLDLYARGLVRPEISQVRPLAEAPKALAQIAAREATGKIVLTVA
jgi:NADPH2:quinone reductase